MKRQFYSTFAHSRIMISFKQEHLSLIPKFLQMPQKLIMRRSVMAERI